MRIWTLKLAAALCAPPLLLAGCGPTPAQEAAMTHVVAGSSSDVEIPPKELLERVRGIVQAAPVSLTVEDQGRGTLVTGWKRYRGSFHIARHWQERTRYRISISPDFDQPTARSRLTVTAETEQRAAEGQRWDREPRVARPERERQMLQAILSRLDQGPKS